MAVLCCSIFNLSAGAVAAGGATRQHGGEARSRTAGAKHFHSHILSWNIGLLWCLVGYCFFAKSLWQSQYATQPTFFFKKASMLPLQYWSNFGRVYFLVKVYWQGTLGEWTKSDGIRSQKLHRTLWPASCPSSTLQYTTRRWGLHTKLTHEEINEILKLLCVVICGMPWNWNFRRGLKRTVGLYANKEKS